MMQIRAVVLILSLIFYLGPVSLFPQVERAAKWLSPESSLSSERDVDAILERIEFLMSESETYLWQRTLGEIYFNELLLLHKLGILTKESTVFNVLSGADFFPGLYTRTMWTSDNRLLQSEVRDHFTFAHQFLLSSIQDKSVLPSLENLAKVYNDKIDVLDKEFISTWASEMKPGDVLFLKFVADYLILHLKTPKEIKEWINDFIAVMPEGVYIVVYDQITPPLEGFPEGFASYLSGLEGVTYLKTGRHKLFSETQQKQWQKIQNKKGSLKSTPLYSTKVALALGLGGKMTLLKKVDSPTILPDLDALGWADKDFFLSL